MSTEHDALLLVQRVCKEALPKFNWGASFLDANAVDLLNRAPAMVDIVLLQTRFASMAEVGLAKRRHCDGSDDEIEIDEPAKVSRGEDGAWVQAWVFVPKELLGEDYKED